jgi:hypothetical protein
MESDNQSMAERGDCAHVTKGKPRKKTAIRRRLVDFNGHGFLLGGHVWRQIPQIRKADESQTGQNDQQQKEFDQSCDHVAQISSSNLPQYPLF